MSAPGRSVAGLTAFITGAASGMGRATAEVFAQDGAHVAICDIAGEAVREVADDLTHRGLSAEAWTLDIGDAKAIQTVVAAAAERFGGLDIVVNNAGILRDKMIFNLTEEEWDIVLSVHLKGHYNLSKHASVVFRQQRSGVFVHTASESGLGNRGQANYAAAKEGIIGLSRTIARDMGGYGVRSNAIRPRAGTRLVISDEMREAAQRGGAAGMQGFQALEAFGKANPPEAIGPFVTWLCTDAAANVNGRDFMVSGPLIGLYSLPEIVKKTTAEPGHLWSVDELDKVIPEQVTGDLTNQWPKREEKPAS